MDVIDELSSESEDEWEDPPTLPLEPAVRIVSPDRGRRHKSTKRHHAASTGRSSNQSSEYESSVEEFAGDGPSRDREHRGRDGLRRNRERRRRPVDKREGSGERTRSCSSSTGSPGVGIETKRVGGADRRRKRVTTSPTSSVGRHLVAGEGNRSLPIADSRHGCVAGPLEGSVGRRSVAGDSGRSLLDADRRHGRSPGRPRAVRGAVQLRATVTSTARVGSRVKEATGLRGIFGGRGKFTMSIGYVHPNTARMTSELHPNTARMTSEPHTNIGNGPPLAVTAPVENEFGIGAFRATTEEDQEVAAVSKGIPTNVGSRDSQQGQSLVRLMGLPT